MYLFTYENFYCWLPKIQKTHSTFHSYFYKPKKVFISLSVINPIPQKGIIG